MLCFSTTPLYLFQVRQYANGLLKNIGSLAEWAQEALVNAQRDRQQRTRP